MRYIFFGLLFLSVLKYGDVFADSVPSSKAVVLSDYDYESDQPQQVLYPATVYANHQKVHNALEKGEQSNLAGYNHQALKDFEEALKLAEDSQFSEGIVDAKMSIGILYYNWGKFEKSLKYFVSANSLALKCNYLSGQSRALNYIGKYYHSVGQFKKSYQLFLKGLSVAREVNDSTIISELYRNIGNFYLTSVNTSKALESFYKALDYTSAEKDPINYASVNNHLGNIYQMEDNFDKAMSHHRLALKVRTGQHYYEGIGKSMKNIGEVFEDEGLLDSALYYYRGAQAIFEEIGYKKGLVKCLNNTGRILPVTDSVALADMNRSLRISTEMKYSKGIINAEQSLAAYYKKMKNFEGSRQHLSHALAIAYDNGANELKEEVLLDFYQLETELQNYKSALEYFVKYTNVKDEINNIANQLNFDELQVAYETNTKEKQNELLRKDNELKGLAIQRKNILILMSSLLILMLLVVVTISMVNLKRKKRDNRVLHELNTTVVNKNEELNELNEKLTLVNNEKDKFYSIMVHELRNPLQWFRQLTGMLNKNYQNMGAEKLQKSLNALDESANHAYHLMDNLLQWTRSQLGRIKFRPEELSLHKIITENIAFAQSALGYKEIEIVMDCNDQLKINFDKIMINTIMRNLISNAIKFTPEKGKIEIHANDLNSGMVEVQVRDSGIGIKDQDHFKIFNSKEQFTTVGLMKEKGSGIGLLLCKEFIEQNGGTIDFQSRVGKGTVFMFQLPAPKNI